MDRLVAIREDIQPFPTIMAGPGILFGLLMRCTVYRCPHCSRVFRTTWGPSGSFVGCGKRTCRKCGTIFDDLSKEWSRMSSSERMLFLLPITVAVYLAAALIIVSILAYVKLQFSPAVLELLVAPLLLWLMFRTVQIFWSIRRCHSAGTDKHL